MHSWGKWGFKEWRRCLWDIILLLLLLLLEWRWWIWNWLISIISLSLSIHILIIILTYYTSSWWRCRMSMSVNTSLVNFLYTCLSNIPNSLCARIGLWMWINLCLLYQLLCRWRLWSYCCINDPSLL